MDIDNTCTICLDDYSKTEQTILECMHVFCKGCFKEWMDNSKNNKVSCPKCRKEYRKDNDSFYVVCKIFPLISNHNLFKYFNIKYRVKSVDETSKKKYSIGPCQALDFYPDKKVKYKNGMCAFNGYLFNVENCETLQEKKVYLCSKHSSFLEDQNYFFSFLNELCCEYKDIFVQNKQIGNWYDNIRQFVDRNFIQTNIELGNLFPPHPLNEKLYRINEIDVMVWYKIVKNCTNKLNDKERIRIYNILLYRFFEYVIRLDYIKEFFETSNDKNYLDIGSGNMFKMLIFPILKTNNITNIMLMLYYLRTHRINPIHIDYMDYNKYKILTDAMDKYVFNRR